MATPKKSRLDELADKITDTARHAAGSPELETDEAAQAAAIEREDKVKRLMLERGAPRPIAEIMADKGYGKGTSTRIWLDQQKVLVRKRDAEMGVAPAVATASQPVA